MWEWGEPSDAIGYSYGMYDYWIDFQAVASNLSYMRNWSITYEYSFDGVLQNSSGQLTSVRLVGQ